MRDRFESNIGKLYLFKFLTGLHFIAGVLVPFFTQWGRLSFTQIMIVQAWFMVWIVLFEIPTGGIADRFGKKLSLALGAFLTSMGALIYVSVPHIAVFLAAELVWALSLSLISGADDALVYETLKHIEKTKQAKRIFARMESIHLSGILVGAPIGSVLAAELGITAPMFFLAVPLFLAALVALTLKEPPHEAEVSTKTPTTFRQTLTLGLRMFSKSPILKLLTFDMVVIATISYFVIWLYQPLLERSGVGIQYFGMVHAGLVLSQIVVMSNFARLERFVGSKRVYLYVSAVLLGGSFIVLSVSTVVPVVIAAIVLGGGFGISRRVAFMSVINAHIPSAQRATTLSVVSMMRRLGVAIVSPFVGFMVDRSLVGVAFFLGAIAIAAATSSKIEEDHLLE